MSKFYFSARSLEMMQGIHPDLEAVAKGAIEISPYDFGIIQGVRTQAEEAKNIASGASQTTHSKHFIQPDGYGHAFDFGVYINGKYINGDTPEEVGYYRKVMQAMVTSAIKLGVQIELGGLWRTFIDAGHVQLADRGGK